MKPAAIKALKELCDALITQDPSRIGLSSNVRNAADRLKRVLDEELGAQQRPPKVIAVNHETEST